MYSKIHAHIISIFDICIHTRTYNFFVGLNKHDVGRCHTSLTSFAFPGWISIFYSILCGEPSKTQSWRSVLNWSARNWSSRDLLFLKRAWWVFVHSPASGNMNETCRMRHHLWNRFLFSKTYSSLVTLELSSPDAEDCSVHGPKCRHVLLWSTHHVNLVDVLCMRSASTPQPCTWTTRYYKPFFGIRNFPNKLRYLMNLMGPVGWRHELMLRAAVPTCLPHSSSEVPRAWHV